MATHSSILARRMPWTEEPGRLQPMGSQRVGHDWAHDWLKLWSEEQDSVFHLNKLIRESWLLLLFIKHFFSELRICLSKEGVEGLHSSSLFLKNIYLAVPGLSWAFPGSSVGKESTCNTGDPGSIPRSGRSTREGSGYPLQCSSVSLVAQLLKNPPAVL